MNESYWNANYENPAVDAYDGWLDPHADVLRNGRVLDLGCGAGRNIPGLLAMGAAVSAADFSENAVDMVRRQFGDHLARTDCFDMRAGLPYGDGSFDAVVAELSLHYFSWSDTRRIIGEIHRALRPGGRLIARVHSLKNLPDDPGQKIEDHYHFVGGYPRRYFSAGEIRDLLSAWQLHDLQEKSIHRYNLEKHILEFTAIK